MRNIRLGDERQRMGRIAAAAAPALAAVVPVTMPIVGYSPQESLTWTLVIAPTVALAAIAGWFLPWRRWPDLALLAVPLSGFACLAVLGAASDGRAAVYSAYSALLFLYIGLTQRPWTSVAVVPPAVGTSFMLYDGANAELVARLPISIMVWLASAEIVARYRERVRTVVDDLETQAHVDPLTGLANRNGLAGRLARLGPEDAAMLVDLDHFKRVNDESGHGTGDTVLCDFGAVVKAEVRGDDQAIRYGGEEVLLLLRDCDVAGAQRLDHRLRVAWAVQHPEVTYSAGIAAVGTSGLASVLSRADAALYAAKAGGRNNTVVHGEPVGGDGTDDAHAGADYQPDLRDAGCSPVSPVTEAPREPAPLRR